METLPFRKKPRLLLFAVAMQFQDACEPAPMQVMAIKPRWLRKSGGARWQDETPPQYQRDLFARKYSTPQSRKAYQGDGLACRPDLRHIGDHCNLVPRHSGSIRRAGFCPSLASGKPDVNAALHVHGRARYRKRLDPLSDRVGPVWAVGRHIRIKSKDTEVPGHSLESCLR